MDWENHTIVPLTVWGQTQIRHKISCAAISLNCQNLVTGSWDGNIIVWSLNIGLPALQPRWIVTGQKTSVTTICCFNEFVVASFMDGSTYHYQLPIGRALKRTVDHNHIHTHSRALGQSHVICAGFYPDLILLDAYTLQITVFLQSREQADWVSCVRSFQKDDSTQIQAITTGGFLKTWSLADISDGICLENSLGPLNVRHVKAMSFHMESRWLLLVTTSQVLVFDVGIHVICKHTTSRALEGGDFFGDKVIFWSKHGDLFSCDVKNRVVTPILQGSSMEVYVPANSLVVINDNKYFIVADINGSLSIWRLKLEDTVTAEIVTTANASSIDSTRQGLFVELGLSVLCSLHISNLNKFVAGCSDGKVLLFTVTDLLLAHFFHKTLSDFSTLNKHTGAVRCLLYPHADNSEYSESLLISGGDDFSVCLWDIFKQNLIHRFCVHSGPVVRLMTPPVDNNGRLGNTICSVSLDHSVAIFSIRDRKCAFLASQHPFPIVAVRWKPGHDFLIVKCLDGSVFVWEVLTGVLDRLLCGVAGEEVVYRCDDKNDKVLYDFYTKGPCLDELPRQPLYMDANQSKSPLQLCGFLAAPHSEAFVVLFNMNILCSYLQAIFPDASIAVDVFSKLHSLTKPLDPVGLQKTFLNVLDSIKHEAESLQEKFHLTTHKEHNSLKSLPVRKTSAVSGTQIIPFAQLFLSLAQCWEHNSHLDLICTEKLGLIKPTNIHSFDVASELGSLSLRHPQQVNFERTQWDLVCTKALTDVLGKFGFSSTVSQVETSDWRQLTQFLGTMPLSKDFTLCEKLASVWLTDSSPIRKFVQAVLPELIQSASKDLIAKWIIYLPSATTSVDVHLSKVALVLCSLSITQMSDCSTHELGVDFVKRTGQSLKYVVQTSCGAPAVVGTVVDLIGRGYHVWQQFLSVDEAVIAILERCAEYSTVEVTLTSRFTLGVIARARPSQFVAYLKFLCKTVHALFEPSKPEIVCLLRELVVEAHDDFLPYLSEIIDILVHCIDVSHMREVELTALLGVWLPQVHHSVPCQRIGVGLPDGKLVIYELRSKRAYVTQAHDMPIAAVRFSPDGKQMVAVCNAGTASLWQLSHGIFDLGQFKLKKIRVFPTVLPTSSDVNGINISWIEAKSIVVQALTGSQAPSVVVNLSI